MGNIYIIMYRNCPNGRRGRLQLDLDFLKNPCS